jgi:hypothetical protein
MSDKKKELRSVSDSTILNENLNQTVTCPNYKSGTKCTTCGGGTVSKRKIKNFGGKEITDICPNS